MGLRPPLSGLPRLDPIPGTVPVLCVMIGTVTFDGLSQGPLWKDLSPHLVDAVTGLGVSPLTAPKVVNTLGLLFGVALVSGFYWLGTEGARSVGGDPTAERLRRGFVHSLVPIAAVYVAAHYFTFLLFEPGQATASSPPTRSGRAGICSGPRSSAIDYSCSARRRPGTSRSRSWSRATWRAHARPRPRPGPVLDPRFAVRSQYWMLA